MDTFKTKFPKIIIINFKVLFINKFKVLFINKNVINNK